MRLERRELEAAIAQARSLSVDLSDGPASRASPLIAARFLSGRGRAGLVERDVSHIDTTGNLRLVVGRPGLFIEASGADRDPLPADRRLRSLKGTAAARVVCALFDAKLPLQVSELAGRAGVSTAQSSRVADLLDREAVLQRDPRGSVIAVDRTKLIERWAEDYSVLEANATGLYLEPRMLEKLLGRLPSSGLRYAVSGSLAACLLAEYAEAKLALIYVDDIDRAARALGLTRVEERGNVLLAEPYDEVVFDGSWQRDGVNYVAPAQLAVDLLTSPGRGPAEGEELLRVLDAR